MFYTKLVNETIDALVDFRASPARQKQARKAQPVLMLPSFLAIRTSWSFLRDQGSGPQGSKVWEKDEVL